MDYEKAYNEAIKRAKAIIEIAEKEEEVYKSAITIFPELRESEDEQIRKRIYNYINVTLDDNESAEKEKWLAWIEKQGEERTVNYPIEGMFPYTDPADTLDGEIENIWDKLRNCDNTFIAAKSGFYEVIHHFATWLEKQGYTKKDVDDAYLKGICDAKHELEKQGEPTDKEKTKFHEGEWIISNDKKSTYQVIEVKRGIYVIRDNVDNHEYHIGIEECEKSVRLFTIQDAKDGDVLVASDSSIFIFKEVRGSSCKHYIALTSDNEIQVNTKLDKFWETARGVKPSTKEQRDTLLKAMADAGYTFDFGKKELKKIEKKSQRMVSAEAKEALYDKPTDEEMKELLRTEYEKGRADAIVDMYVPTQISPEESLGVSSEKYMDIVDTLTQGGQKPAKWSLGDERVIAIINNALTESNTPPDDYDKVYDWLESIKQRIGG